eukprot:TRINITY_DN3210_c0_g1_i1.p1 TRINITY_DN3210_c0_g1~~TRINITY_DN3210_c0_g1_i1.p1  ORF type:complete len:102 (+),score=13.23 TRINITY_DN3210_c0_g1_i1:44-307(+)
MNPKQIPPQVFTGYPRKKNPSLLLIVAGIGAVTAFNISWIKKVAESNAAYMYEKDLKIAHECNWDQKAHPLHATMWLKRQKEKNPDY